MVNRRFRPCPKIGLMRREPNAPVNVANAIWKGLTQPKPVVSPDIVPRQPERAVALFVTESKRGA